MKKSPFLSNKSFKKNKKEKLKWILGAKSTKTVFPKQQRIFYFTLNEQFSLNVPAPGHCQPDQSQTILPSEMKMTQKKYEENQKKKENFLIQKQKREKEKIENIKSRSKFDYNNHQENYGDLQPFETLRLKKRKGLSFNQERRFSIGEKEKWKRYIKIRNKTTNSKLSFNQDSQPGPAYYCLINHWPGKMDKKQNYRNYLKKISKGTTINPYYLKINQFSQLIMNTFQPQEYSNFQNRNQNIMLLQNQDFINQGRDKDQNNYISESDFQQCKGFIGDRPLVQIHQHFAQIGQMVQKIQAEKKTHVSQQQFHQQKEKEVRVGPIVFKPNRGDWKCSQENCKNWNYSKRTECNMCGQSKEVISQEPSENDWKCNTCGFQNKSYRNECYKCCASKMQ